MGAFLDDGFDLAEYGVSSERGFLPTRDPLTELPDDAPETLQRLDDLARRIPSLIDANELRPTVEDLPIVDPDALDGLDERELHRVYNATGFLASAYVHQIGADPVDRIPAPVAVPLHESTDRLDRLPVLSYDAYALNNWRRHDATKPITPHNVETVTNFVEMLDEEWFIVIHVVIEAKAGPAVAALPELHAAVSADDEAAALQALRTVEDGLNEVVGVLDRMPEHNSPENYGPAFRPYIQQFQHVTYEGVEALDEPQSFRGETGAQSSLFPALDGGLGIDHDQNPLVKHVRDMREYMPPGHRRFVADLEAGPDVHAFVAEADDERLRESYDSCIDLMIRFREVHNEFAETYVLDQIGDEEGTGGTPYVQFLGNLIEETRAKKLA